LSMRLVKGCTAVALTFVLFAIPMGAAEREVIRTDWSGFQKEVASRRLKGGSIRVAAAGKEIKTELVDVLDSGLAVRPTRATKQWGDKIPKDQVTSVRFNGRTGKRGLVGALVGLGAGAGIGAGVASENEVSEGIGSAIIPAIGVGIAIGGAVAGYFIGRSMDTPIPEFILTK
jgi:hypothetical protein